MAGGHLIRLAERAAPPSRTGLRPVVPNTIELGRSAAGGWDGVGGRPTTREDRPDPGRGPTVPPESDATLSFPVGRGARTPPTARVEAAAVQPGAARTSRLRPEPAWDHGGDELSPRDPARLEPIDPPARVTHTAAPRSADGVPAVAAVESAAGRAARKHSDDATRDHGPAAGSSTTAAEPAVREPVAARRPRIAVFELPTRHAPALGFDSGSTPSEGAARSLAVPSPVAGRAGPGDRPRPVNAPRERPVSPVAADRRVVHVRIGRIEITPEPVPQAPARTTVVVAPSAPHPLDSLAAVRSWSERGDR